MSQNTTQEEQAGVKLCFQIRQCFSFCSPAPQAAISEWSQSKGCPAVHREGGENSPVTGRKVSPPSHLITWYSLTECAFLKERQARLREVHTFSTCGCWACRCRRHEALQEVRVGGRAVSAGRDSWVRVFLQLGPVAVLGVKGIFQLLWNGHVFCSTALSHLSLA